MSKTASRPTVIFVTLSPTEAKAVDYLARKQFAVTGREEELKFFSRPHRLRAAIDYAMKYISGFEDPDVAEKYEAESKAEGLAYGNYRFNR